MQFAFPTLSDGLFFFGGGAGVVRSPEAHVAVGRDRASVRVDHPT